MAARCFHEPGQLRAAMNCGLRRSIADLFAGPALSGSERLPRRALAHDGQTVRDRQHDDLDAPIGGQEVVERLNGARALVGGRGVEHLPHPQHIVEKDEPVGPQTLEDLFVVVPVVGLVGVDEGHVELRARRQRPQRLQRRAEPQLDLVRHAGLLPVAARDRRPLLVDVAAQQLPSSGRPRATHSALYPVNVPTSTAERAPMARASKVMNAPCSGAICIMLIGPSLSSVSFASSASTASWSLRWAARYS